MMSVAAASKLSGTLASEQTANTRVSIPRVLPAMSVDMGAGPSRPSSTQKEEDRASAALLEMSRRQDKTTPASDIASIWRGCHPGPEDLRFAHNVRHPPFSSTLSLNIQQRFPSPQLVVGFLWFGVTSRVTACNFTFRSESI
jgi:hypothetical protein